MKKQIRPAKRTDEATRILKAYRMADDNTKRAVAKLLDVERDYKNSFSRIK